MTGGSWSPVVDIGMSAISAHLSPTGEVALWDESPAEGHRLLNPTTGALTTPALPSWNTFCAGMSFLADGRLFVAGGHIASHIGPTEAGIYDPFNDTWTLVPPMRYQRWYPTTTLLSSGDVLVYGGEMTHAGHSAGIPEVYDPDTNTWRELPGADLPPPTYPWMFALPGDRAFYAGPGETSYILDTSGRGSWSVVATTTGGDRTAYPNPDSPESAGSAVMYAPGQVLVMGGGRDPIKTSERIDLNGGSPRWVKLDDMEFKRQQHTATILADGSVLVTGGTAGVGWTDTRFPILPAEIWEPSTGRWTTVAAMSEPRWYHSTAILLPDARVFVGGGMEYATPRTTGIFGGIDTYEIYSPPYLERGPRPRIETAPTEARYGSRFAIQTDSDASISELNLVRLGSVTHGFNFDQRNAPLSFRRTSTGIEVTAPLDSGTAPPGYYMLFAVNGDGVPSEAAIVRLDSRSLASETADQVDDRLDFRSYVSMYDNDFGLGEKWLFDAAGGWSYILPTGEIFGWNADGSVGKRASVGTVYFARPELLVNAARPGI